MAAWRQLEQQYQELWLKWEAQEGEVRQGAQQQADEQERQAFINSLISQVIALSSCQWPSPSALYFHISVSSLQGLLAGDPKLMIL